MREDSSEYKELTDLLSALQDESADESQLERLNEILLSDAEARRVYMDFVCLDEALQENANEPIHDLADSSTATYHLAPSTTNKQLVKLIVGLTALAASLLVVVILQWNSGQIAEKPTPQPIPETTEELTDDSVALLAQAIQVQWTDPEKTFRPGGALSPGLIQIEKGLLRLEFYSGATVILEGPAEFELISAMKARCNRGEIRAQVPPPASGFTIETPDTELVDLGTEFGISVNQGEATDVVVFNGKVELYDLGQSRNVSSRRVLNEGQSLRLNKSGATSQFKPSSEYLTYQLMETQMDRLKVTQREKWDTYFSPFSIDPEVLTFYSFEKTNKPGSKLLQNRSGIYEGLWDGVRIGCDSHKGRFPWKEALRFKNVSDRVRVNIPGTYESITLATWVRLDQFPEKYGSLLMSDGYEEGEIHWQISSTGAVSFSVQGVGNQNGTSYRPKENILPTMLGEWVHLAVVYNREKNTVTSYMNGTALETEQAKEEPLLRIGTAEIGNWFTAEHQTGRPIRNLKGSIDELIIASRAFTDQEVYQLYSIGTEY